MIPQISSAISKGFNSKQIIDFILKKFPQHSGRIKDAMAAGFTVDQVLKFVSGGKKALASIENENPEGTTPFQQMRSRDIGRREEVNKRALQGAGLAATSIAAPMAATALQRAIPPALQPMIPALTEQVQSHMPTQLNPQESQQPPVNQVVGNIPEPSNIQQPELKSINIPEILTKHNSKEKIDQLIGSGNTSEGIKAYFQKFSPKQIKEIEKESGQSFEQVIDQYIAENPTQEKVNPVEAVEPEKPIEPTQPIKIEKNSVVSSPNGIGELKELRNGLGLVEVDGKLHKVKEEDLESSPMPEKDLASLYDELVSGIESETGEDVSRMVQWAGYNPSTNTLQFLPHSGKLYKYGNISKEDAALLTDILSTRKTSGSNFIGAWKKDSKSPIGAALSKLIKKLQSERGGKGNEYEETHEPIYSAYEPAIEAKKEKMRKKKKI